MPGRFVIDNSVVMSWCFEDEASGYADSVLSSLADHEALVPAIWPLEVGNVLLVAERTRRISESSSARFLELLSGLPIKVEQETPARMTREIVALARARKLSTYDASYLDLAMRQALPIATQDKSIKRAARKLDVKLFKSRPAP